MININDLKTDLRKLGINFITGGFVSLMIDHLNSLEFHAMLRGAVALSILGVYFWVVGLLKGVAHV